MADRHKTSPPYLEQKKDPVWWDWWSENPIEVVLVVIILVLFFALPRAGCGISEGDVTPPQQGTGAVVDQ